MTRPRTDRPRRRIVLYSHDTVGLGHLRRNLAIASVLVADDGADVLVISGSSSAGVFPTEPGIDVLALPGVAKRERRYASRSLGCPLSDVIALRSAIIRSAVVEFDPHLLIVDKVPRGVDGELDATLAALTASRRTRCVLGLRDVLDEPATTVAEWDAQGTGRTIDDHYDAVWWYGDPSVFDALSEYGLNGSTSARSTFTGYLAHDRPTHPSGLAPDLTTAPYALCLVGGGEDGLAVARAFTDAPLPEGLARIVVTGPFMPRHDREELEASDDATVLDVVPDCTELIRNAAAVVSMGGYNSICELLAAGVKPLVVPRVTPRLEQLVRAERLAALGMVDLLHPRDLGPQRVGTWIATGPRRPDSTHPIDLDGLHRIPDLVDQLIGEPGSRTSSRGATAVQPVTSHPVTSHPVSSRPATSHEEPHRATA